MKNSSDLLIGIDEITQYLCISLSLFKKFIKKGMPAVLIDTRWYAHKDNLDDYFKRITRVDSRMVEFDD